MQKLLRWTNERFAFKGCICTVWCIDLLKTASVTYVSIKYMILGVCSLLHENPRSPIQPWVYIPIELTERQKLCSLKGSWEQLAIFCWALKLFFLFLFVESYQALRSAIEAEQRIRMSPKLVWDLAEDKTLKLKKTNNAISISNFYLTRSMYTHLYVWVFVCKFCSVVFLCLLNKGSLLLDVTVQVLCVFLSTRWGSRFDLSLRRNERNRCGVLPVIISELRRGASRCVEKRFWPLEPCFRGLSSPLVPYSFFIYFLCCSFDLMFIW